MKSTKAVVIKSTTEEEGLSSDFVEFFKDYTDVDETIDLKNIIKRDSREKKGKGWYFESGDNIEKMEVGSLKTGDYTIQGYEKDFIIERKGSTAEFAQNIFQSRFEDEMKRLDKFKFPFLICEFTMEDLMNFPTNSGIPPKLWCKVKVRGKYLITALTRYQLLFKTRFILAGNHGKEMAESLFKMMTKYGTSITD